MSDSKKEKCGVVGVVAKTDAATDLYFSLFALQHRGQEGAGIAVFDKKEKKILYRKGLGLVTEAFKLEDIESLRSGIGIGHTYYSIKLSTPENAQPHIVKTALGDIAIAHNGIIINADQLRDELLERGHLYKSETEEEVMAFLLADEFYKTKSVSRSIQRMLSLLEGSYALMIMFQDRVFAIRDTLGIKPLCIGNLPDGAGTVAASESVALDVLKAEFVRDVEPGEVVELKEDGFKSNQMQTPNNKAYCFFEWVYFSRTDSILDGREVYKTRKRIGWRLAKEKPVKADVVIPIPDSGRGHAYGYALGSGIKFAEGLIKNRYTTRTFIMPDQKTRELGVRSKLNAVKTVVSGRRVILIDDSIVRGTTMRKIVQQVREAGATEVHVRIGSPPITAPCYFGIDMTTRDQLIAPDKDVSEISKEITADSLGYISINGIVEALKISKDDLCLGCVTGEYPMPIKGELYRHQKSLDDKY
jgi:amidophosphoribosyltransferase